MRGNVDRVVVRGEQLGCARLVCCCRMCALSPGETVLVWEGDCLEYLQFDLLAEDLLPFLTRAMLIYCIMDTL